MKAIELKEGKACKCSNRHCVGPDGRYYWYNLRTKILYSTDPHTDSNPKKAVGSFILGKIKINQL